MKINRKEAGDTRFVDLDVGEVFDHAADIIESGAHRREEK